MMETKKCSWKNEFKIIFIKEEYTTIIARSIYKNENNAGDVTPVKGDGNESNLLLVRLLL